MHYILKKPYHFVKVPIFAYQLLGQLLKTDSYRAGSLEHTLSSHEISKLSRASVWDCVSDVRCNFRTRSRLWRLPVNSKFSAAIISSLQIFTDVISLEEKQMECIWRITCFEEDVLVVFPTGFDKKKTLYFHFSSEIIKLQTFALSMQWKSPETTLGLRIDSFLSNLRSSVLGGSVKVGGQGKG